MQKNLFLITASVIAMSMPAMAQDHDHHHHGHRHDGHKNWGLHLDTATYITDIYSANEADEEISDIFTHSHISGFYKLSGNLSVNGNIKLEGDPAGHAHGGGNTRTGDRFFEDHPLFIEELTLNYDAENYGGYIGKFNPAFGIDSHDVPGWFGLFVFEEFEMREKLGAGGYASLGDHRLDVSTFFADTSFLQESLLFNRDALDKNDGGVSNTEDFSSLSTRLSGDIIHDAVGYYVGYAHQGNDNGNDEDRFTIGLNGTYPLTNTINLNAMVDVTDINHLNGEGDHDRAYLTAGIGATYRDWNIGGTYTKIENDSADATEGMDGAIAQASIGYDFGHGFGIDVGYQMQNEEGETSKRLGSLLRYHAEF